MDTTHLQGASAQDEGANAATVTATNAKGAAPKKAAGKGAKGKGKGKGKGDAEDEETADRSGVEEADDDEEGGKVSALRG